MISYVINSDFHPDRLRAVSQRFKELGLPFSRIRAVDPCTISTADFNSFVHARPLSSSGDSLTTGGKRVWTTRSMAYFLSHYKAWELAANSTERFSAIFDDDMHLDKSLGDILASDVWIPAECGVIRLEPSHNRIKLGERLPVPASKRTIRLVRPSAYDHCWPVCAGAMIIKREVAQQLIEVDNALHTMADIFLFAAKESLVASELTVFQMDPAPAAVNKFAYAQRRIAAFQNSNSELETHRNLRKSKITRRKLESAARILQGYRKVEYWPAP